MPRTSFEQLKTKMSLLPFRNFGLWVSPVFTKPTTSSIRSMWPNVVLGWARRSSTTFKL